MSHGGQVLFPAFCIAHACEGEPLTVIPAKLVLAKAGSGNLVFPTHVRVNRPLANGAPQAILFPTHVGLNRANSRDTTPVRPAPNQVACSQDTLYVKLNAARKLPSTASISV
jgi:hypothetical protein